MALNPFVSIVPPPALSVMVRESVVLPASWSVPPPNVIPPEELPRLLSLSICRIPLLMNVPPRYELVPLRNSVPVPD